MNKSIEGLLVVLLLLIYLIFTNYIQDKRIYPLSPTQFDYSISQGYASPECFDIRPNYLFFYNKWGIFEISTHFEKKCNFTHSKIFIHVTDMKYYWIQENKKNLTMNISRIPDNPNNIRIIVNSSDMEENYPYRIVLRFKLKENFYNIFRFRAEGTSIEQLRFYYKGGINGYIWEQGSFNVLKGEPKEPEESFFRDRNKKIRFDEENEIHIKSSPISKFWFFMQKIADALILGILVVFIYELLFGKKNKKI